MKELAENIGKLGLLEPIVIVNGNVIIDGRNRMRACEIAGVTPTFVAISEVLGAEATEEMILDYIGAKNLQRRDLTPPQRAAIGAELKPMYAEAAHARQRDAGGDRKSDAYRESLNQNSDEAIPDHNARSSLGQAAKAAGTSRDSVNKASALKEREPDLFEKLKNGETTVNAATKERKKREANRNPKPAKPQPKPASPPPREASVPEVNWIPTQRSEYHDFVVALYEGGMSQSEITRRHPHVGRDVRHIIEREKNERAARAEGRLDATIVDWESFPPKVKEREAEMRRHIRREVEADIEPRVQEVIAERMAFAKKDLIAMFEDAKRVLERRKGVFTRSQFRLIQAGLHTDRALSEDKQKEVFDLFTKAEIHLLGEADDPRTTTLPTNLDDLLKRRKTPRRP